MQNKDKCIQRNLLKQKGASTPLVIIFLAMSAVILTIFFKLYPPFYEHWQLEHVMESFKDETDIADVPLHELETRFDKRLVTNSIRDFNSKDSVFISKEDGVFSIELDYEVRIPMYRNIDAVVKFHNIFNKDY